MLERPNDRVLGLEEMLSSMAILGVVAASDVSAGSAQAQMYPGIAHGQALPATVSGGGHGPHGAEMRALRMRFGHLAPSIADCRSNVHSRELRRRAAI